eukprot:scaffold15615_cov98-Phaeocystis_antarctica.AAC.1
MQARTTPRGARRAAPRTCGHPADASLCLSCLPTPSTPPLAKATPAALLSAAVRKKTAPRVAARCS